MEVMLSLPEDEVVEIPEMCWGVKARVNFKEGAYIVEYAGLHCQTY